MDDYEKRLQAWNLLQVMKGLCIDSIEDLILKMNILGLKAQEFDREMLCIQGRLFQIQGGEIWWYVDRSVKERLTWTT